MAKLLPPDDFVMQDEAPGVVASAGRIKTWAIIARPGDEFVYATRASLPFGSEGARAARLLHDQGFAHLRQRPAGAGLFNYVLKRSGQPWPAPRVLGVDLGVEVPQEAAAIDALFPILLRYARFGRPCPTDAQLAASAGLRLTAVKPALAAMASANMIEIRGVKAPTLRIVSIVGTRHATGMIR